VLFRSIITQALNKESYDGKNTANETLKRLCAKYPGEYEMGDHHDGMSNALPVHRVFVHGFYMEKYEVTNTEYATGLTWAWNQGNIITIENGVVYKVGGGTTCAYCRTTDSSAYSQITWNGSQFGVTEGKESHTVVMVSWYGSAAYANWRSMMEGRTPCYDYETWECTFGAGGYRLPTEAEWEKGARGREYNPYYRYPWGDSLISSISNYDESGDPYEAGLEPWNTPVGFYTGELHYKVDFGWPGIEESYQTENGENGWGLHDMAGNEWEWCYDWYEEDYYSHSPKDNPTGPIGGVFRICRGGSWDGEYQGLRCAVRGIGNVPEVFSRSIGFRLVLD